MKLKNFLLILTVACAPFNSAQAYSSLFAIPAVLSALGALCFGKATREFYASYKIPTNMVDSGWEPRRSGKYKVSAGETVTVTSNHQRISPPVNRVLTYDIYIVLNEEGKMHKPVHSDEKATIGALIMPIEATSSNEVEQACMVGRNVFIKRDIIADNDVAAKTLTKLKSTIPIDLESRNLVNKLEICNITDDIKQSDQYTQKWCIKRDEVYAFLNSPHLQKIQKSVHQKEVNSKRTAALKWAAGSALCFGTAACAYYKLSQS
jgi:hypothetical protein